MPGPPPIPQPPPMGDEATDVWRLLHQAMDHLMAIEAIADRLAATCADPQAVADYQAWWLIYAVS